MNSPLHSNLYNYPNYLYVGGIKVGKVRRNKQTKKKKKQKIEIKRTIANFRWDRTNKREELEVKILQEILADKT